MQFTVNPWVGYAVTWIQAIVTQYIGLLGGAFVAVALFLYERFAQKKFSYDFLVFGLWTAFILSNFLAWHEERANVDSANQATLTAQLQNGQLQAQLNNENNPNLQASIQELWVLPSQGKTILILLVDVRNLGAPSVADYWQIYAKDKSGKQYQFPLSRFQVPFTFPTSTVPMTYRPSYWLPDRTATNPIPRGGDKKGFISAVYSGFAIDPDSVAVTFNDVNGQTHQGMNVKYLINGPAQFPPTMDE